ncbi:ABC transporter substrate-binding protein [Paracraurococcus ruber]|uniref:Branched-chain amino acid ABC transporter substrate-binding protein n=1 Tax=Paracraurococcus ruber TaxID=77675 RepID=A0ABS1CZ30_9PROT|nr:ABC transporter substrate-binding protein [Paracraurococcus ruber]MBK1659553.1 branched-chain amino acid ABC transporter substrate-binding protein [Paracraurococcus ruber]TDG33089.1 branched-chain amino acid ABC transporter substrate-binding protein [Paracraurococcus ruber]
MAGSPALSRRALVAAAALLPSAARAQASPLVIGYLSLRPPRPLAATLLEPPPADEGAQGARLGLRDNATTGRFTGQAFALEERRAEQPQAALEALRGLLAAGLRLVVADLPAELLLPAAAEPGALLLNIGAPDDALRNADCRRNILHVLPSRAMLADALAQYLAVKRWRSLFLAVGPAPGDQLLAEAMRRAARKFGLRVVLDKTWTHEPGAQRTDTGHMSIAAEAARFTQGAPGYDILLVCDEAGGWGESLAWRTTDPRPVAGTQGLTPTIWSPVHEQWGATQLQRRFRAQAGRAMTPLDHAAWLALRAIGEGATRSQSTDPARVINYLRSPEFELAGFKGARLSFRDWDGQLRQPILLAGPRALVAVSPQPGFQHRVSELDTLGTDRPETACRPS